MSVANILKSPTLAPAITSAYADGGGGTGLFLPLLGGTMDASPAGVIKAHTITDIVRLEGASGLGELLITTKLGGDDISIDATPSSGFIYMDAVDVFITTENNVGIKGSVIVQPPGAFSYPSITSALDIKNWVIPAFALSGSSLYGINVNSLTGLGNSAVYGMYIYDLKNVAGFTTLWGIKILKLESLSDTNGIDIEDVKGTNTAMGLKVFNVQATFGYSYGLHISTVTANNPKNAFGIYQQDAPGGNNLRNRLEVGNDENSISDNASLTTVGTSLTSIQSTSDSTYFMEENGGNTVVSLSASNLSIFLPSTTYIGAVYLIIKKHSNIVNIDGNGNNINGTPFFTFSGIDYSTMSCVWDGSEWLAHLN